MPPVVPEVAKTTSVRMAFGLILLLDLKALSKPVNERLVPVLVILPGAEFSVTGTGPVIEA